MVGGHGVLGLGRIQLLLLRADQLLVRVRVRVGVKLWVRVRVRAKLWVQWVRLNVGLGQGTPRRSAAG